MTEDVLYGDPQRRAPDVTPPEAAGETVLAWEEIEPGRFMPRRTRGSYPGGKLG